MRRTTTIEKSESTLTKWLLSLLNLKRATLRMKHTIVENPKTKIRKIRRVLKYRKNPSTLTTGRRMGSRRRATRSKKEVSKGT